MATNGIAEHVSRVWVVFPVSRNLEDARRYGEFKYIFQRQVQMRGKAQDEVEESASSITEVLAEHYNPESDYLLMVGSTILLSIAVAMLTEIHGAFKALHYDQHTQMYTEVEITAEKWYENWR